MHPHQQSGCWKIARANGLLAQGKRHLPDPGPVKQPRAEPGKRLLPNRSACRNQTRPQLFRVRSRTSFRAWRSCAAVRFAGCGSWERYQPDTQNPLRPSALRRSSVSFSSSSSALFTKRNGHFPISQVVSNLDPLQTSQPLLSGGVISK
jgi:hypothetical protein